MPAVTGLVLAGGLARRMGRIEKGLQLLRGRPLIEWVIDRLRPQVRELLVSANEEIAAYRRLGFPVLPDLILEPDGSRAGPLAGLHAGLCAAAQPLLASVPCDAPFLPLDLVQRLHAGLVKSSADVAVVTLGGRPQPVFVLARSGAAPALAEYLRGSGRRADGWYADLAVAEVAFDDQAEAFASANTLEELRDLELGARGENAR